MSQAVPNATPRDGGQHGTEPDPGRRRAVLAGVSVMLAVPFVALLWVSSYAKDKPRLFGFPFFYWYQFLWVFITAVLTYVAFVLVNSVSRRPPTFDDRYDERGARHRDGGGQ